MEMSARLAVLLLAVSSTAAHAQLFRCKGADGKTVYSDTACEAKASGGALKVVPNSTTADPNAVAADKKDADKTLSGTGARAIPGAPPRALETAREEPAAASREPGPLSYSDRERLRGLEMTLSSTGATNEQKEGARMEISSIRSGREARLSREDRDQRDALSVDLGSVDRAKRSDALRRVRDIYYR